MQTVESLNKKIKTTHDLLSIVKTMKSLAAVNIRQFEGAVRALDEYNRIVNIGWRMLFHKREKILPIHSNHQTICLVLGSDQGMCGRFNESILELLEQKETDWRRQHAGILYWTIGERIRTALTDRNRRIDRHFELPGSLSGIHRQVQQLVQSVESRQRKFGVETLHILYNRTKGGTAFESTCFRMLPLDEMWIKNFADQPLKSRCLPMLGLGWEALFHHLLGQYLFVSFYRALGQSLAGENAARLQSMQAAEKNILEMEENLRQEFRETRQSIITSELLDIVSGFEAIHDQE